MIRVALPLSALLCVAISTVPVSAQNEGRGESKPLPVVQEGDLMLLHYVPKTSAADKLTELAYNMWGRTFVTTPGSTNARRNIFQNVDSVVIYDSKERADRILRMLKGLDGAQQRKDGAPITTRIIKLEYATADEAKSILRPFARSITLPSESGQPQRATNLEFVESRSAIIVRDVEETVDAIENVVAQLDTPRAQVLLTAWVIRGGADAVTGEIALPEELSSNLRKLVPMPSFHGLGMGLVNTTIDPKEKIALGVSLGDYGRADLELSARAFNQGSNVLHLKRCHCKLQLRDPAKAGKSWNNGQLSPQSFSTQVSLREGEYTVLGAVGSKPVFVVLKMTKMMKQAKRAKPN